MSKRLIPLIALSACSSAFANLDEINFNRDIRPILSDKCFYCHGPDEETREGDLRLDIREDAIEAYAIVPGDAEDSELVYRIFTEDREDIMPRPSNNKQLSEDEKQLLVRWINEGAKYEEHWSYAAIEKVAYPSIDDIVKNELENRNLSNSPEADKNTLIRRVSLDLIGLPPTPDEVKDFLADKSPKAYEKLVDRLLASPHYGEKMAISWLDAVRYADTVGYHGDQERDASPFRDYVIEAFNQNKPFDQFTIEQLAGDLLPNPTVKQKIAASYNRLNQISAEGGIQNKEYIKKYQAERVRTTSTAWLGSTLACAECHDHKFDPFTAKDFYSMAAFFSDILEKGAYTGDGSYQEDIQQYLNSVYDSDSSFGPELTVLNETFHQDPESVKKRIAQSEKKLARGSAKAKAEFKSWLQSQAELHSRNVLDSYPLSDDSKNVQAKLDLPTDLPPLSDWASLHFEAKAGGSAPAIGLKIDYQVGEESLTKGYTWGPTWLINSQGAALEQVGEKLRRGMWLPLELSVRDMGLPEEAIVLSITPLRPYQGAVKNLALRTQYLGSIDESLSPEGQETLQNHLEGEKVDTSKLRREFFLNHSQELKEQRTEIAAWKEELYGERYTPLTISAKPREVKVLPRGNWMDESGETVLPASPTFLPNPISSTDDKRLTRLDLAEWIVHPDNPLTARAYVNRLWALFFENALSAAPEDLGLQGVYPTYPTLLDWLAAEFIESGWDVKHIVREIVLSQTYRQSSRATPEEAAADPKNELLARQTPIRLSAEIIRDNALRISGLLNPQFGGKSARPYQPDGYYDNLNFPKRSYIADQDDSQYRRGVYMHWQRTFLHPMVSAFDAGGRDECIIKRNQSNTPLQALTLLNDPTQVEAARAFAESLVKERGSEEKRIETAYLRALGREPSPLEISTLKEFLNRERERFEASQNDSTPFLEIGLKATNESDSQTELAAYTSLCRAILNLHETITRY
ncbi:PSD1 and planctomycete cytochrome C domain-containing protein [Pelagicoccus mobilis]|uniref:PSD1 domain-containing protein n=1 Tax=Pelagicoccus mobilis TaxID=415221 RepID=A0A934RWP5_9BACT|nr:PSD1 and planctomycete cytochrome C domain-containing protein [Pelagicoccus mobilis]MBK1879130.1 PSD1 domain-containing protein [Pelagicoccus mobilis]